MTHAFFKALLFMARRLGDRRDGGQAEHRPHVGAAAGDAVHVRDVRGRRAGAGGLPRHLGLLLEGRDPRRSRPSAASGYWILYVVGTLGRPDDGLLRVPDGVPRLLRRADAGGAGARAGPSRPRRAVQPLRPASARTPTSASPAPSTTSPSASWPMKVPMAILAVLSHLRRRRCRSRGVTHVVDNFLDADLRRTRATPASSRRPASTSLGAGGRRGDVAGRHRPRLVDVRAAPGTSLAAHARACRACTGSCRTSGTSTSPTTCSSCGPCWHSGAAPRHVFERFVVDGVMTGTRSGRAGGQLASCASAQSGLLRNYALLLATGVTGARPLLPGR